MVRRSAAQVVEVVLGFDLDGLGEGVILLVFETQVLHVELVVFFVHVDELLEIFKVVFSHQVVGGREGGDRGCERKKVSKVEVPGEGEGGGCSEVRGLLRNGLLVGDAFAALETY